MKTPRLTYQCSHRATATTIPMKPTATKIEISQPNVSAGISNIPKRKAFYLNQE
jgi:hypothetical protein